MYWKVTVQCACYEILESFEKYWKLIKNKELNIKRMVIKDIIEFEEYRHFCIKSGYYIK